MKKEKRCYYCDQVLPLNQFVSVVTGYDNPRGRACYECYEWREELFEKRSDEMDSPNEEKYVRQLIATYGDAWQAHALPHFLWSKLREERDFCPYCGESLNKLEAFSSWNSEGKFIQFLHLDHMEPLQLGGEDSFRNAVIVCHDCNLKKGKALFKEWLPKLEPKFREIARAIYLSKMGCSPEDFEPGQPTERVSKAGSVLFFDDEE